MYVDTSKFSLNLSLNNTMIGDQIGEETQPSPFLDDCPENTRAILEF